MRRMMFTVLQRCAGPVRTSLSRSEFHMHSNRMPIFAHSTAAGPGVDEIFVGRCPARSRIDWNTVYSSGIRKMPIVEAASMPANTGTPDRHVTSSLPESVRVSQWRFA